MILLIITTNGLLAQTLPVGLGNMEDYLRREQLMGQYDEHTSFATRPLLLPDSLINGKKLKQDLLEKQLSKFKSSLSILSPQVHIEGNSRHPYYANNGAMVPSKGLKSLTSFGVHLKAPFLSIQLRPEIYLSQNRPYDGFPDTLSDGLWENRYRLWNESDLPEQFGEGKIRDVLIGQSHVLLNHWGMALGFSTENLWWGPGKRNSLLMSNNARSFPHLTFRSTKPLNTIIGSLEWNIIAARLNESGFNSPSRADGFGDRLRLAKNDDWRYLSALSLIYSPKWIKGLSIGANRSVQQYSELANKTNDYFPVAINLFRKNDPVERDEVFIDQLLSIFTRWVWYDAKAEFYFEYGRNDAAFNLRDALLSPQHSRAYIFGLSKIIELSNANIQINYEHTQMQQAASYLLRNAFSWYMHGGVTHGYTHRGEVLGAAIGPGSNLDYLNISYFDQLLRVGLTIERWTRDNDFLYLAFEPTRDFRRFWIDYAVGLDFDLPYKQFLFSGDMKFIRSLNYQWELYNSPPGGPYFVNGVDVSNFHFTLKTIYLF